MQAKLALSFAIAALIMAGGGFLLVSNRLNELRPARPGPAQPEPPRGRPPGVVPAEPAVPPDDLEPDPLAGKSVAEKVDVLVERLEEMADDDYEYWTDYSKDMYELKREVRHLKNTLKRIVQGLGTGPGGIPKIGWGLVAKKAPIGQEVIQAYRKSAEEMGIKVEDGRVTVRGFLNMSPNTGMPIEYFMTRFPEASHETLVHLIGDKELKDLAENPYLGLKGLATALYKGLVAAGFEEGEPTHPDMESPDPRNPEWVMATGDVVYVTVRYVHEGETHVARATDWVIDPRVGSVLPHDCFRFTGSTRGEDPDTGEEVLAAEAMGLFVSVWPTYTALVEVALASALRNDYTYNFARIPKPKGDQPLYLDVIFSKTPVEPEGEGAKPLPKPPARDTGSEPEEEEETEEEGDQR